MTEISPEKNDTQTLLKGVGLVFLGHAALILLANAVVGVGMVIETLNPYQKSPGTEDILLGFTGTSLIVLLLTPYVQWLYVVPMVIFLGVKKYFGLLKGVAIGLGLTVLLGVVEFGLCVGALTSPDFFNKLFSWVN